MKKFAGVLLVLAVQALTGCGGASSPSTPSAPSTPSVPSTPAVPAPVPLPRTFHVSFSADPACTALPAVARTRTYIATLGGSGAPYLIDLFGATFGGDGSYVWHTIYATFADRDASLYFQDPPIWDQVTASEYVVIYGERAAGSIGELPVTLPFPGFVTYCAAVERDPYPECAVPEIVCKSNNHTLTITR